MPHATLDEWLEWIGTLHPQAIALGLERVATVYRALALPPPPPVITVAGTNGKGSLVALLEAILGAAGYRAAAYTSPHLLRFNERIRVSGAAATDDAIVAALGRVDAARGDIPLTYFEFTTLAALVHFAALELDAWLLEVGLGGRLDAVNVVDPDLALFAAIDVDHVEWLGPDRDSVGREKAGILRAGRPAVSVEAEPPRTLVTRAAELGVPLHLPGREFHFAVDAHGWRWHGPRRRRNSLPRPALVGSHQYANAAAVLMALECLAERLPVGQGAIRQGLLEMALPGRFQVVPGEVETVLDVAHNPHAARALAASLLARPCTGRTLAVVAMRGDKAIEATVAELARVVDGWFVAPLPGAPEGGGTGRLERALAPFGVARCSGVERALAAARDQARPGDRVVVFGSFLTVAAALNV